MRFRRRLYKRGSSVETTIPKPILFALSEDESHDVIFQYDAEQKKWYIDFEKRGDLD